MTTKSNSSDENEDIDSEASAEVSDDEIEEDIRNESDIEELDKEHEEDSNSNHEENNSNDEGGLKNLAWADSISKILRTKSKSNKPLVLSKAKKLTEVKAKPKPAGFEVELGDGKIREVVEEPPTKKLERTQPKGKRKREILDLRVKPNILERDRERVLAKIATKGVVQLFNAVRSQQKDIKDKLREAGPLEVKRAKVLKNIDKNTFLDVLMGEKSQNVDEVLEQSNKPTSKIQRYADKNNKKDKVWDVLRDNFMMDAKMKDWDKELEIEEENEIEME